jgi:hypothetical protein
MAGDAPSRRAAPVERLRVELETAIGSGEFAVDARLRVERIEQRGDDRLSTAQLSARLDDGFDLLSAVARYHPDLRVRVRWDSAAPVDGDVLFDGYPQTHHSHRAGLPRAGERFAIAADSAYTRWTDDPRAQVFGRQMRTGAIEDGLAADPAAYRGRSEHVAGLPCLFNQDGLPNRAAEPLSVVDAAGEPHAIYPFTDERDPTAEHWSLLDAARYLVWFHHAPGAPIRIDQFLRDTRIGVGASESESSPGRWPARWLERLAARAIDLNCEATNLAEALALLADAAGVHVVCLPALGPSRFAIWAAEDGAVDDVALAWGGRHPDGSPRYATARLPAADVVADNQLQAVDLRWDQRDVVNAVRVVGAVRRWELTVPLVPGWSPQGGLDNVAPIDRAAAKADALTPDAIEFFQDVLETFEWYRRFHRDGSEFADFADVARLWVLNEDGAFGAAFDRNPPFDQYAPFDFAAVASAAGILPGAWVRRARPMQRPLTADADGSSRPVWVEVSFDSGATWHRPVGAVEVLNERAGIRFGLANPTAMVETDGDWLVQNMWYALIDQTFRVRATAVFEADERVNVSVGSGSAATATSRVRAGLDYAPREYRGDARGPINILADAFPDAEAEEVDDTAAARRAAAQAVARARTTAVEADFIVPWIDRRWPLGSRVRAVRGRTVALNGLLRRDASASPDWAVVGRIFIFSQDGFTTKLALTRAEPAALTGETEAG